MHIKLSTLRKLLWHYRVATPTIMPANKELPNDDQTTGGPCQACNFDHDSRGGGAHHTLCPTHLSAAWGDLQPDLGVGVSRESPGAPGSTHPNRGRVGRRAQPPSAGATLYRIGRGLPAPGALDRHRARAPGRARRDSPPGAVDRSLCAG